jgi:CxxC motif-containing protein (DUF1111 family)
VQFALKRKGSRERLYCGRRENNMWPETKRRFVLITRLLKYQPQRVLPLIVLLLSLATIVVTQGQSAVRDPGVRAGGTDAGGPIPGLNAGEANFFARGLDRFNEIESVSGGIEPGNGLGPRFNSNQCASCHLQPAVGGTSPAVNPQVAIATLDQATNAIPFFVTPNGPAREARFKFVPNADGTLSTQRDGGVHDLFVITNRTDAVGCDLDQPNFEGERDRNNIIFRIPTPTFGAGLIEEVPDRVIVANQGANLAAKQSLGISGHPNRNGNDGTIARFGWKAQNKSLQLFSGEAYNVEMGVTNEIFNTEREEAAGCRFNPTPEDATNFGPDSPPVAPELVPSDVVMFSHFMRFLAPPTPDPDSFPPLSVASGRALFESAASTGCALCHTPTLHTGSAASTALSNKAVHLFSDLLVHHMGPGLADNIVQGQAGADEFRSAPLWGLGQRIFFLHDGRTRDLMRAIQAHRGANNGVLPDSEANGVIDNFNALTPSQQQDILNFLRSL